MRWKVSHSARVMLALLLSASPSAHSGYSRTLNLLDFLTPGQSADPTVGTDISTALARAITVANEFTSFAKGRSPRPTCIHIPSGIYHIGVSPPMFKGAGCVIGDGSSQTIINLDRGFSGDLFCWAEAWIVYGTSGPTVRGLRINGDASSVGPQNALMFYDRNDNVSVEDVYISSMPGRAVGVGLLKPENSSGQAYIRESHLFNLRVFESGRVDVPAVEFTSRGGGQIDGTNEVSVGQMDIFGSRGVSLAIHNDSAGVVRDLKFDSLRIEGSDRTAPGATGTAGDLLQIGDSATSSRIGHLSFTSLELIDPPRGYSAIHISSAAAPGEGPSRIYLQGYIGGGRSQGEGLRVDNGSLVQAILNQILTAGSNCVIGPGAKSIILDGAGSEKSWTFIIDPSSSQEVSTPSRQVLIPPNQTP